MIKYNPFKICLVWVLFIIGLFFGLMLNGLAGGYGSSAIEFVIILPVLGFLLGFYFF